MKPKPPKRKKCKGEPKEPFPIIETMTGPYKFRGQFNGFSVKIERTSEMEKISTMGCFGKGSLSRSCPVFNKKEVNILRQRQYDDHSKILEKYSESYKYFEENNIFLVDDSDSDIEEYCKKLKPKLLKQKIPFVETLNLSLEEAFFLMYEKECLNIINFDNKIMDNEVTWIEFCNTQPNFIQNYVVFSFFRNRNWVVKSGLKFGGEFLLYKDGPAFYHASYVVIIDVVRSQTKDKLNDLCNRSMAWSDLICQNRLTETAAKEMLIAQVHWPQNLTVDEARRSNKCIKDFQVQPMLLKRWVAKTSRMNFMSNKGKGKYNNKSECESIKDENNDSEKRKYVVTEFVTNKKIKDE